MVDEALTARLPEGRRIYAVGDVHGHLDKLDAVHAWVRTDLQARPVARPLLLHLGDLIDRGPDTAGCVDRLVAGSPVRGVPTLSLRGNHEQLMMRALVAESWEDVDTWLDNGGDKSLASWGVKSTARPSEWLEAIPARHLVFLRDLRVRHTEGKYLFVHAGVRPGVPLDQQRETDFLWIREEFLEHDGPALPDRPETVVVHGHTPMKRPALLPWRLSLDTGAGKGGPLTCAMLEGDTVEIFQA